MNKKTDIAKIVLFDRGVAELKGEKKYVSLIAMVVVSDNPIAKCAEQVSMGAIDISDQLQALQWYEPTYKFGEIGGAITNFSTWTPDKLEDPSFCKKIQ